MSVIAHTPPVRPRRGQGCARCGRPRTTQIDLTARPAHRRCSPLAATHARGLCEGCALDVLTALELELERQFTGYQGGRTR